MQGLLRNTRKQLENYAVVNGDKHHPKMGTLPKPLSKGARKLDGLQTAEDRQKEINSIGINTLKPEKREKIHNLMKTEAPHRKQRPVTANN